MFNPTNKRFNMIAISVKMLSTIDELFVNNSCKFSVFDHYMCVEPDMCFNFDLMGRIIIKFFLSNITQQLAIWDGAMRLQHHSNKVSGSPRSFPTIHFWYFRFAFSEEVVQIKVQIVVIGCKSPQLSNHHCQSTAVLQKPILLFLSKKGFFFHFKKLIFSYQAD